MSGSNRRRFRLRGQVSACALVCAGIFASLPAEAITYRDDVGEAGTTAFAAPFDGVVQTYLLASDGSIFFNCTGSMINPRTVLTASHCFYANGTRSSEAFGLPGTGAAFTPIVAYGPDTFVPLFDFIATGNTSGPGGGLAFGTDLIIHPDAEPTTNGIGFGTSVFPDADVTLIALDRPLDILPQYAMLFSPLQSTGHSVVQVGYGSFGTGTTGGGAINGTRRAGNNYLGLIGSQNDYIEATFGLDGSNIFSNQTLYHTDFDRPDRDTSECVRGPAFIGPNDLTCSPGPFSPAVTLDGTSLVQVNDSIDWFPDGGDARSNEVGTDGGDSGGPLFADELASDPVILGVLSGGWTFTAPVGSGYGDISYYNPLFAFFQFIVENNPATYARAERGHGNWSDGGRWSQLLDPAYLVIDAEGNLINGIPEGTETGIGTTSPQTGTVFDTPIDEPAAASGTGEAEGAVEAIEASFGAVTNVATAQVTDSDGNAVSVDTSAYEAPNAPLASSLPVSSPTTGPGSTGFVPNNTDGTPGTAFVNAAEYFYVTLDRLGTTTVDIDVQIDRLTLAFGGVNKAKVGRFKLPVIDIPAIEIPEGNTLQVLLDTSVLFGGAEINGRLETTSLINGGVGLLGATNGVNNYVPFGTITGTGTVSVLDSFENVSGIVAPGGLGIGTLTVEGDYVQGGGIAPTLSVQLSRRDGADLLAVTGTADLGGALLVGFSKGLPRFGQSFDVLTADGGVNGDFDTVVDALPGVLFPKASVGANAVSVAVDAVPFKSLFSENDDAFSFAAALDDLRADRYGAFEDLFSAVDLIPELSLGGVFSSLRPELTRMQTTLSLDFSETVSQHLTFRGAELRGGHRGLSTRGFHASHGDVLGFDPTRTEGLSAVSTSDRQIGSALPDKLGIFIAGSLVYDDIETYEEHQRDLVASSGVDRGNMTFGVDYRATDNLAVGFAASYARTLFDNTDVEPLEQESFGIAAFASAFRGNWYLDSFLGYADQATSMEREFSTLAGAGVASATPDGTQFLAGADFGYTFGLGKFAVSPILSTRYSDTTFGGYTESGADIFNLTVRERSLLSAQVESAVEVSHAHRFWDGTFVSSFVRMGFARDFGDNRDVVTAAFAGAPDTTFLLNQDLNSEWMTLRAGFTADLSLGLSAFANFQSDIGRGALESQSVQGGVKFAF